MKHTKEIEKLAGWNVRKSCLLSMVKKVHFKLWRSIFIFEPRLCENYKRYQYQIFTVSKAYDLSHGKQKLWCYTQNPSFYEGSNVEKNTTTVTLDIWKDPYALYFSAKKSHNFVMNLISTQFQLSFEVYYIFVAKNWKFWIFCLKILTQLAFATSATSSGQTMNDRKSLME